jgi:hypothetical protein
MKKLVLIIAVVAMALAAASTGFAAQMVNHGGHYGGPHGAYSHNGHFHGYHGGFYGGYGYTRYYPGYRYVAAPYVIGAPGIYVGAPYGPRVIIKATPY